MANGAGSVVIDYQVVFAKLILAEALRLKDEKRVIFPK